MANLWNDGIKGNAAEEERRRLQQQQQPSMVVHQPGEGLWPTQTTNVAPGRAGGGEWGGASYLPPAAPTSPQQVNTSGATPPGQYGYNAPTSPQIYNSNQYQGPARANVNSNVYGAVKSKLNDPTQGTTHKYQGLRWLQEHPGDIQGMLQLPGFEGWTQTKDDSVHGAGGSTYDLINGDGSMQWTATSGPAWDKNGIPGVNSLGVNSSMAKDGIKGNYAAANTAAANAAAAAGKPTYGYAHSPNGVAPGQGGQGGGYGGGYGGGTGQGGGRYDPSAPYPGGGAEFDDPWGQNLERLTGNRLTELGQNAQTPNLEQFMKMLLEKQQTGQDRAGAFANTVRTRAEELRQDPYTDQQADAMRTKAMDQLNRRRQDTLRNRREEVYARGFEPTSGLVRGEEQQVNTGYDDARNQIDSDLLMNSIDEGYRRKNQALDLEGLAQNALRGGDIDTLQMLAQRSQLENQQYTQNEDRRREALTTASLPLNLMDRRSGLAISALNAGQDGQDPLSSILQLLNYQQQNDALAQQGRNNNMQGFGTLAQVLMNYFQ